MLDRILEDLKQAQLKRDVVKVSVLRLLLSELNYLKIQKGLESLSDEDVFQVVRRELKKRQESVEAFKNAGRAEQSQKEEDEAKILENYLPAQMSDMELTKLVEDSITEVGAKTPADLGKVISLVLSKAGSGADGARVSALVREKLSL